MAQEVTRKPAEKRGGRRGRGGAPTKSLFHGRWKLALLLLSLFLLGASVTVGIYYGWYLKEYHEVPYDFSVVEGASGINVDTDALHFGHMVRGGGGSRIMTIDPVGEARLVIRMTGNGSSYLYPDKNDFLIRPGEIVVVTFRASIPSDAPLGDYAGQVEFRLFRA